MHPPLHKPDNETACLEVIRSLEICHTQWQQFFGACNQKKLDLNYCLRGEREARALNNRTQAAAKKIRVQEKMAKTLADF